MTKIEIIERFIADCMAADLTIEECIELSAKNMISVVSAAGKGHCRIEVENLGSVEVEC